MIQLTYEPECIEILQANGFGAGIYYHYGFIGGNGRGTGVSRHSPNRGGHGYGVDRTLALDDEYGLVSGDGQSKHI